jgi:hypothetical protein
MPKMWDISAELIEAKQKLAGASFASAMRLAGTVTADVMMEQAKDDGVADMMTAFYAAFLMGASWGQRNPTAPIQMPLDDKAH